MNLNCNFAKALIYLFLFNNCQISSGNWVFTSTVREEYEPKGVCERYACEGTWIYQSSGEYPLQNLGNGCRYILKYSSLICDGSASQTSKIWKIIIKGCTCLSITPEKSTV